MIKTIYELLEGESTTVKKIHATGDLKRRLYSLGFHKGAHVVMNKYTLSKQTIQVSIERTKIAIRMSEALEIEIY